MGSVLWGALIAAVAASLYAGTLDYALVGLDDQVMVVEDHAYNADPANLVGAFGDNFFDKYYRPLHRITFILDALRGGTDLATYHTTNLVLHALGSLLVFAGLRALGYARVLAGVLGLVFAVHPLFASVVAWIPGRDNALVSALLLGAFVCLVSLLDAQGRAARLCWTLLHLVLFLAALFSKEMAAMFPVVAIAYLVLCRDEPMLSTRRAPLFIGWGLAGLLWLALRSRAMAGGGEWESVGLDALATSFPTPFALLGKFALPVRLSAFATLDALSVSIGLLAVAGIAAFSRGGRPRPRRLLFGACWFGFFLAPTLIQRTGLYDYGEYRAYWLGFGVMVVLAEILQSARIDFRKPWAAGLALLVVVGLGAQARAYASVFDGDLRFWSRMVEIDPKSGWGWFHVGRARVARDEAPAAEQAFGRAEESGFARVDLYVDWSALFLSEERFDEAEAAALRALAIDAENPYANFNLGVALQRRGRCREAIPAFEAAVAPTRRALLTSVRGGAGVFLGRAYHQLAGCLRRADRSDAADAAWQAAIEADPADLVAYGRLVRLRVERGDLAGARKIAAALVRNGGVLSPGLRRKLERAPR